MESVKIYLTKSGEVASLLYCGCRRDMGYEGLKRVTCGRADSDEGKVIIPSMLQGKGYFFCAAFSDSADNMKAQRYEIIVA